MHFGTILGIIFGTIFFFGIGLQMRVTISKFFSFFYFTPSSFLQVFVVALAAAAPPAPSPVYDDTGSFELNDEIHEGYILGIGMGFLQDKNMDKLIQGKKIEELLGERDLFHRGLIKRSPIPPFDPVTIGKKLGFLIASPILIATPGK